MKTIRRLAVITLAFLITMISITPYMAGSFEVFAGTDAEATEAAAEEAAAGTADGDAQDTGSSEQGKAASQTDQENEDGEERESTDEESEEPQETAETAGTAVPEETKAVPAKRLTAKGTAAKGKTADKFYFTIGSTDYRTLGEAIEAYNRASANTTIVVNDDYVITQEDLIPMSNTAYALKMMSSSGNKFTLTRGDGVDGNLLERTTYRAFTVENLILDNGDNATSGALLRISLTNGLSLTLDNVDIMGGSADGNLIEIVMGSGYRQITGKMNGCTIDMEDCSGSAVWYSQDSANNSSLEMTNCTVYGPSSASSSDIIRTDSSRGTSVTISGTTIYRGMTAGSAVSNDSSVTGSTTVTDSVISGYTGEGSTDSISATRPLIMHGKGRLTLNGATAEGHVAADAGVCAVDAGKVTTADYVNVYGATSVTGNKAAGKDANLRVNGTIVLQIPAASTLTGTVGITTANCRAGVQFANLGNSTTSMGADKFANDKFPSLGVITSGTAVYWAEGAPGADETQAVKSGNNYYYKGLSYTLTEGNRTAKVNGYDTNNLSKWTGIPVIVEAVPYGTKKYAVNDITYFGSAATLRGRNIMFEDEMLDKMANGAAIELPDIATEVSQEILDAVDGYVAGEKNSIEPGSENIWKNATIDPETNTIEYSLKYLQMLSKDQPLDFVFGVDQSGTMCTNDATANGVKAPRVMWMMALLQKTAYELIEKNGDGYDNRVAFVPWGDTATASSFMDSTEDIDKWFKSSDAYAHAAEGTDHGEACNKLVTLAKQSMNSKRNPVVIYMSDFVSHCGSTAAERKALRELPCSVYGFVVFNSGQVSFATADEGWVNAGAYEASDPAEFMSIFSTIINDAIGMFLDEPLSVTDDLSTGLKGLTPEDKKTEGELTASKGKAVWTLGEQEPLLTAAKLHETKFTVDLGDALFSGELPTNGDLTVNNGETETNRISAENSPVLRKDFLMSVVEKSGESTNGSPISGAEFELRDSSDRLVWSGTADSKGQMTIPYGSGDNECRFPAGSSYTLKQLSTDGGHVLPDGSWTLSVGNDYRITTSTNSSASDRHATLDAGASKGRLMIYNEQRVTAFLTVSKTAEGDYSDLVQDFGFSISLPDMDGVPYHAVRYASVDEMNSGNGGEAVTLGRTADGTVSSFTLKTGEYLVVEDVPVGEDISIAETDSSVGSETGNDGKYRLTVKADSTRNFEDFSVSQDNKGASFRLADDAAVSFTNTLNQVPATAVAARGAGLGFILLALAELAIIFVMRRRRCRG